MTLKLIFVFKSPQLRFLKSETDFRILRFVSQKTHNPIAKQLKTAKTGQDVEDPWSEGRCKRVFETGLEVLAVLRLFWLLRVESPDTG
jgi:hypothetical protein